MSHEHKPIRDFSSIPASACTFLVPEVEFGDNGKTAKSSRVRLLARSGKPIEHWFWGPVVHDLAGMHLHKPRLPIDYVHDSKEIVGYLNHFDISSGDLVASGALVPFKDSDRATEIIHKTREGVPYEASINFGGDGLKIQEIAENETAEVNGFRFDGPGVIVREWPLRGVAICPYGADMNTASTVLAGGQTYAATVMAAPDKETHAMKEQKASVEIAPQAEAPAPVAEELKKIETPVEGKPVEAVALEAPPAVETAAPQGEQVAAAPVAPVPVAEPEPKPELSRDEFLKIVDEFGAEIAAQTVKDGGTYVSALKLAYVKRGEQIAALERQCSEMKATRAGSPVPVEDAKKQEKARLFKTGK